MNMKYLYFAVIILCVSLVKSCEYQDEAINCVAFGACGTPYELDEASLHVTPDGFTIGPNFAIHEHVYVTCTSHDNSSEVRFVIGNGNAEVGCCPTPERACKFPEWISNKADIGLVTMNVPGVGVQRKCVASLPTCELYDEHDLSIETDLFECPYKNESFSMVSVNDEAIDEYSAYAVPSECPFGKVVVEIGISEISKSEITEQFCVVEDTEFPATFIDPTSIMCKLPCCNQSGDQSLSVKIFSELQASYTHSSNSLKLQCFGEYIKPEAQTSDKEADYLLILLLSLLALFVILTLLAAIYLYQKTCGMKKPATLYDFDFRSENRIAGDYPLQR